MDERVIICYQDFIRSVTLALCFFENLQNCCIPSYWSLLCLNFRKGSKRLDIHFKFLFNTLPSIKFFCMHLVSRLSIIFIFILNLNFSCESESRTNVKLWSNWDSAMKLFDYSLANHETKTQTLLVKIFWIFQLAKDSEELPETLLPHTNPRIPHLELQENFFAFIYFPENTLFFRNFFLFV